MTDPGAGNDRHPHLDEERARAARWERTLDERVRRPASRLAARHPALWRRVLVPAITVAMRVSRDALGIQAGSLTYGAFLSIPPLLLIVMAITGALLHDRPDAAASMIDTVTGVVPGLDQVLDANVALRDVQQLGIGAVGVVTVVWAASGFAARARHSLGVIFRTERTGLVAGRASAALLGTPILLLFAALAVAGSLSAGLRFLGDLPLVAELLGLLAVVVVSFVFVLLVYRLLTPGRGPRVREHLPGAVVFAIGWLGLHVLGATYVARVVARSTALYGAVGAIFGLFAFIYLSMWLFLLGAEVSEAYRRPSETALHPDRLPPVDDAG